MLGGVKRLHSICSRVCGVIWCGGSWVYLVPSHAIILARPLSVSFDVASEGPKVGVGKDVGMPGQDVGGIVLEGLLPDRPVSHRPQHSVLEEHGERGQRGQKQPVRIEV